MKTAAIVLIVVALLGFIGFNVAVEIGDMTGPRAEFGREVHGHLINAYYSYSPEQFIQEIEAAKAGMRNLNLHENMYGAYFSFGYTADNSMQYQYRHLDSLIQQGNDLIKWRDSQTTNSPSFQYNDMYRMKMEYLRNLTQQEGWSDDIAQAAYYANYHPFFHFQWLWRLISFLVAVAFMVLGVVMLHNHYENRRYPYH